MAEPRNGLVKRRPDNVQTFVETAASLNEDSRSNQTHASIKKPRLLSWDEIEPWQRDNPHITAGYRPCSQSYAACSQSLFWLHNESVNVHSHLFGAFLFSSLGLAILVAYHHAHQLHLADALALGCFFAGAVACLSLSSAFHLVSNHSADVSRWSNQLDFIGIVVLIVGSFVPSLYYGFYCEPVLQRRYWAMVRPTHVSFR